MRGATLDRDGMRKRFDISTHAPLAGRDYTVDEATGEVIISTHAPLAGRD